MPRLLPLLALLASAAILLLINFFFAPLYIAFLIFIIFAGIATAMIYSHLRLARLEVEHKLSTQQLKTITKDMGEGVVVYTPEFKILSLNPAAEKTLRIKEADALHHTITPSSIKDKKLKTLTQVVFPSLAPVVSHVSEKGWPQIVEISTSEPSLQLVTILNRITNQKGAVIGFVKLIQDKTLEKELLKSKTEFITTSAHQLRTPLTAMNWAFESLRASLKNSPKPQEIAAQGLGLSERALKIINDMLDVIQIEGGGFGYTFQAIDIVHLVEKIVKEARVIAQEYGITVDFAPPAGPCYVSADPNRMGTAIATLIDNAIKYNTEKGSVTIVVKRTSDNRFVQTEVSDTGVGVPEDEIKHIFEKFYRGKRAAQFDPNGSGLGLFIAKNIVEKHGGKIQASSMPGRGSTFQFTVPLSQDRTNTK